MEWLKGCRLHLISPENSEELQNLQMKQVMTSAVEELKPSQDSKARFILPQEASEQLNLAELSSWAGKSSLCSRARHSSTVSASSQQQEQGHWPDTGCTFLLLLGSFSFKGLLKRL